ncbi:uncharacterized protein LOC135483236 [Lineus longissimus]|uniref:uncharacterized protein LOC135483236 n=1 Tax=Lineus longissimus TaxID=88925 RepID=UPI002B4F5B30
MSISGSNIDVMISFDEADKDKAKIFADKLTKAGLKVWIGIGKSGGEKGLAIVQCKAFIQIMSAQGAASKALQDELSLAYISNTPIFPVGLANFSAISPNLDSGRRLILAKINWTFFTKDEHYESRFASFLNSLRTEIESGIPDPDADVEDDERFTSMNRTKGMEIDYEEDQDMVEFMAEFSKKTGDETQDFWTRHFNEESQVPWLQFRDAFTDDYKVEIVRVFGMDKEKWLCGLIYRDIFELAKDVKKSSYLQFCINKTDDPHYFFSRVQDYATAIVAMKEVFDMDSTVRLTAVQNLGKFRTPSVITTLMELLEDAEPNMRAVAALALGRSGKKTKKVVDHLLKSLEDEDRLVRESVCLSLGSLKAERAVQPVLDRWRNDPISTVREAARIAITKIGGDEAAGAIKVTQVLSEEMANLRKKRT